MNLKRYIARRYIRSKNSHSVINHISRVSMVAMSVPVMAMVVLLSVFNGLENMVRELYKAVDADVVVLPASGTTFDEVAMRALKPEQVEGVASLSYTLEQGAMAEKDGNRTIVRVKGVDEAYTHTLPVERHITSGLFATEYEGEPTAVASRSTLLALRCHSVSPQDKISLYAINRQRISTILPTGGYTRRDVGVAGIYNIDDQHSDMIFISLSEAQRLLNYPDRCSSLEVTLQPGADAAQVKQELQSRLGGEYKVLLRDENNSIYRLMALEKWGVFLISLVVMIIASLTIVGTLVMIIIDKREERATLLTLGATPSFVRGVFVAEGDIMVRRSLIVGLLAGIVLTLVQQFFGIVQIDAATLMVDAYPVELQLWDVVAVAVGYYVIAKIIIWLTVRAMLKN